jgi:hypothetical protein
LPANWTVNAPTGQGPTRVFPISGKPTTQESAVSTFEFFYYLMLFGCCMLSPRCHPNGSHSEDLNTKSTRFVATLFARLNFAPDRDEVAGPDVVRN